MREVIITGASARDYQDADMLILITLEEPEVESSNSLRAGLASSEQSQSRL